jgi:hypothetical protein
MSARSMFFRCSVLAQISSRLITHPLCLEENNFGPKLFNLLSNNYAFILVKYGLENRDYGRRGSAALTMRHPSIRKSCH